MRKEENAVASAAVIEVTYLKSTLEDHTMTDPQPIERNGENAVAERGMAASMITDLMIRVLIESVKNGESDGTAKETVEIAEMIVMSAVLEVIGLSQPSIDTTSRRAESIEEIIVERRRRPARIRSTSGVGVGLRSRIGEIGSMWLRRQTMIEDDADDE
jgi:hypothetical protein